MASRDSRPMDGPSRRSSAAPTTAKMAASASSSPTSATEAVEAARKRKHRELVKRQYYQKLEVLKELRQQQDVLKAQHSALLRSRPPVVTFGGPTASVQILHDMYVEATREKERQMKENTVLRHIHNQYLSFHKNLATASAAEKRERQAEAGPKEATKEPESESDSPSENQRLELKLITADACYEVIRAAYAEVRKFQRSRDLYTSDAEVLGWTHRYRLEGEKLQYSICKFFPGRTAKDISDRGWAVMTNESSYKALHSRGLTSNLYEIQTVNDDNRVFCRELQRPGQNTIMKTLVLMSRFQTEDGYMTIYRALDQDKFGFTGIDRRAGDTDPNLRAPVRVVWLDMFAWTSFESRSDGSGVDFQFGGEMKHFSADNAKFWMMEVLLMGLRWESRTVAPLITLQR